MASRTLHLHWPTRAVNAQVTYLGPCGYPIWPHWPNADAESRKPWLPLPRNWILFEFCVVLAMPCEAAFATQSPDLSLHPLDRMSLALWHTGKVLELAALFILTDPFAVLEISAVNFVFCGLRLYLRTLFARDACRTWRLRV
jgi:hypothetical protein